MADDVSRERRRVEAADTAEPIKKRRVAALTAQVDTAEHRRAQAAFNAAQSYIRLGEKSEAAAFADMAARDPLLKEKAEALRLTINKLQ